MVVLSNPTGNTIVRAIARALRRAGWLDSLYTTIAFPDPGDRWLPRRLRSQLLRRHFEIEYRYIHTHPWLESVRLISMAVGYRSIARPGGAASVEAVYREFDRHVAGVIGSNRLAAGVRTAYAYEDAAEDTFDAARNRGLACIYEMPIAHWQTVQRLLHEEAERLPEWRHTIQGLDDSPAKFARKNREIELADTIIVPSRFVMDSLPAQVRASKRCVLAPFGAPSPGARGASEPRRDARGPLRVMFAGAMTQRKGLADLFAAMRLLNRSDVELVVLGAPTPNAPLSFYRSQYPGFQYEGTRPHAEVLQVMRSCDVFVLPALVEGRALVQLEALASGLPLLVTPNTGGDDLVDEGRTGFTIPIRSPEAIAERLAWFADHREALAEMRQHAIRKASETSWLHYENRVLDAVRASSDLRAHAAAS
jgi:glycosyltransferase involved in cell wall biosynthesis